MIYLISLGVVMWYGLGLMGSAIAIGAIAKELDKMFPMLPPYNTKQDKAIGYLLALAGIVNLVAATLFGFQTTRGVTMRWEWLK